MTWPVDRTCFPPLPELSDPPTDAELAARAAAQVTQDNAAQCASTIMWALSGRQYGLEELTARPCPDIVLGIDMWLPYVTTLEYGTWVSSPCGCMGQCTVSGPRVVHLPGPVAEVVSVTIDGVSLDESEWQLEGDALYRTEGVWPRQNLGAPLGEDGTWCVVYLRGVPVPAGVDVMTGALAKELLAACNDEECRIPRTVTGMSRRGVSYDFDPSKLIAAGKTGLQEIDMWLASVNPNRLMAPPEVF
ncbi:head-tail adaptor [Mycobacterium phage Taptic]|uniref:Head-to-tail adaptor n=1 Tax=Mycobacterium phage Taptic TaxID=1920305 RepID=A0A1J0MDY1_9CAUD|nr:head-tail adaptor [Mycobacterium phage Taptic]APD19246.1 head-to-tail adaptor [Mycobacterium phage Taptic]AVO21326.1 head-to-tail adaptor [Mycobacterium phage Megabear]WRQ08238.1 head-to-tail adaptor [Mycobacterium phage harman]